MLAVVVLVVVLGGLVVATSVVTLLRARSGARLESSLRSEGASSFASVTSLVQPVQKRRAG